MNDGIRRGLLGPKRQELLDYVEGLAAGPEKDALNARVEKMKSAKILVERTVGDPR